MTVWFCQHDGRKGTIIRRNLDALPSHTIAARGIGDARAGDYWIEESSNGMLRFRHTSGYKVDKAARDLDSEPAPTIMADGINSSGIHQYEIEISGAPVPARWRGKPNKPLYRIPSMTEIAAVPWNGLTVASTFAGCGGSSLGYRMAGFRVLWANEFVPSAQNSYRANASPQTVLDGRDVRKVQAAEILKAIGLHEGELDIFDGSPPCQAFSTAGKLAKGWGKERSYEHGVHQCNEDLFFEYIRLLRGIRPRAFVAENVSGLVKGVSKGYFLDILAQLKVSGYCVRAKVLDAQWLGVPQVRQRVIFIGVREDLRLEPCFPVPLPYRYSVREAIPWIIGVQHDTSGWESFSTGDITDRPAPTMMAGAGNHFKVMHCATERRKFTILEVKRLCAFPDDFVLAGTYAQQWERLGNSVPPLMMHAIAAALRDGVLLRDKSKSERA